MLEIYKTKKKRSARPGRLKGKALEALRRECFERDGYRCQHKLRDGYSLLSSPMIYEVRCGRAVTWETGHMHHIKTRGAGGRDELSNVVTLCADCHHRIHSIEGTRKGRRI